MLVVVVAVCCVQMAVVQVVDVVAVGHRDVAAVGSVHVGVCRVFDAVGSLALVPVIVVLVMPVAVVDVVDVVAVGHRDVAAVGPVHMGMRMADRMVVFVVRVIVFRIHDALHASHGLAFASIMYSSANRPAATSSAIR